MIRLLDRYIFVELLRPFLTSLTGLCFIIFTKEMLRLVDLVVSRGISLAALGSIVLHLLPSFLVLTLPIACLIASISAFNRMSFDNEVIAIRAAGVSFLRINLPVVVFSGAVFFLTVYLSQWGQPWASVSLKTLALSVIEDELTLAVDSGVFNEPIPGLMVYVPNWENSSGHKGVFIADQRNPEQPLIIVAEKFQMLKQNERQQFGIRLFDGAIHQIPKEIYSYHRVTFGTYDFWLPSPFKSVKDKTQRRTYEDLIQELEKSGGNDTGALRRLMEYYKDTAFPVATFVLGLLGVPVGIVSKRSGKAGGFAIGVLVIIGFYLFNVLGEFLVTKLVISPFVGAWMPNIVLACLTGFLLFQARKQ
ncbi:MAG: LptF/LptG family permease [Nitrospirota bacterium]|nr:LptF/LptG family permease [Nitrospirota bacterium]